MIYLKVIPEDGVDFTDFVEEYHRNPILQKFDIKILQERHIYDTEKIKEIIIEKGQTAILSEELILEHLIAQGTSPNVIISILQKYLDKISIDNELIIVDPYFFPNRHPANYSQFLVDILTNYLPTISELRIITSASFNSTIKAQVETDLRAVKPGLTVTHTTTDNYHDRFWISNRREKGIIVGTSMNGLGNKYALIDRLNTSDVRVIIASLLADGLIYNNCL